MVELVQAPQVIELGALLAIGHAGGSLEVVDRSTGGVQVRALEHAGQERRAPVRRVALGQPPAAGVAHHDETGKLLVLAPQAVCDPRADARIAHSRKPVFIMKSAGEWLFDSVKPE